ncbi:imelysin family protein [Mangrovivirga sp. M17]|uniref:Imelysin family protein n=1 Tax=Mangrovivirga halotolerans TaxID=2993936 RepID=A0ABT3RT17_9BACT|nr:imelysin family protein [Mangrovivirga halotolerans]MCX2744781.1 imelysin family protein [Mangrovivirga halotolerans]
MSLLRRVNILFYIIIAAGVFSCSNDENIVDNYDRQGLNLYTAEEIIVPSFENFSSTTSLLDQSVTTFTGNPTVEGLNTLRADLKNARMSWQWCAMYNFGPSLNQGLLSIVNEYLIIESNIEQNILNENFQLESLAQANARGFKAMGYLLYGNGLSDEEIINSFINSPARGQYLKAISSLILSKASLTTQNWASYIDQYASESRAGTDAGSSLSILINEINKYWESTTRDKKLGIPLGKRSEGALLPDRTEAYYAGYSTELLTENITAYKYLFEGRTKDGVEGQLSLSNYLKELGATDVIESNDLAEVMSTNFQAAIDQSHIVGDPLKTKVETNYNACDQLYLLLQKQIIFMKSDMPSVMGISISYADNDGD